MERCSQCTKPIELGSRFCENCGAATSSTSGGSSGASAPKRASSRELLLERVRKATLGLYDVRGEIGRGGMAAVYLAHDLRLNRKVALKVMLPGLSFTEGMSERFKLEARTAANLDHPNIVTIYSVEEVEELLFFAMKYVEGRALDTLLKDVGPLACDVTQYIIAQVSRALAYAHEEGVVHRDVKPGNVILDRRGLPVVTDFGIAKAGDSTSLTQTGSIVGTPIYMSPEQWRGKRATSASDQYALGVMAFEMLIGEPPFRGSAVELQLAHVTESPKTVRELRTDVPESLNQIVTRMLAKNPDDRFPTLHDVAAAMSATLPNDPTPIRHKLVEVGFLADGFGGAALPATPISPIPKRTSERTAPTPPASTPPTPTTPSSRSGERTAPRVPTDATIVDRQTHSRPPIDAGTAGTSGMATVLEPERRPTPTTSSPRILVPPRVGSVRVSGERDHLAVGEHTRVTAEVLDEQGRALVDRRVTWATDPAGVVELSPDGRVHALRPGPVRISATCEGAMSSVALQVAAPPVAPPVAAPAPAKVPPKRPTVAPTGGKQRWPFLAGGAVVTAIAVVLVVLLSGEPRPVDDAVDRNPPTDSTIVDTGTTSTTGTGGNTVAESTRVTNNTVDTAVKGSGTGAPIASSIEILNAPRVLIMPGELALRSRVLDENGQEMSVPVTWISNNPSIASVDSRGVVRTGQPGMATIRARSGEIQSVVQIAVEQPRIATVEITGAPSQLREGEQASFNTRVLGESGPLSSSTLSGLGMTPEWASSRPDVAVVDLRSGRVTGVGAGTTSISVRLGQYVAQHSLTVLAREVAPPPKVYVDPNRGGPAAKTREQLLEEATATIHTYAKAVESRDLAGMQRLYPSMPADDRVTWESFFRDAREISYVIGRLSLEGNIADTDGSEAVLVSERTLSFYSQAARRRQGPLTGTDRIRLQRTGGSWRIRRVE